MRYKNNVIQKHSYNERGVTLVALIVTIIVLLILSGIAVASFKQSNIITRARDSAKRYSSSQIDEKIDLAQQNLVVARAGYNYSIRDLVEETKKENKNLYTVIVDENSDGKKATYIIDNYFYEFTKKDDGIIVYNRKADASDKDKEKYKNKNELKDLKSGIITFKNDKTDWTNENVNVTVVAKTEDKSVQSKIDNGTYFVVSTVNDANKLTTLTKSITSQTATNQGDTIYACLTDGYGTYVATATEKIENIDKTKPTDAKPIAKTTTNSITATNTQEDKPGATETKASGIKTTQYQIKKNEDTTWGTLQSSGTFTGLTQNIKYDVRTQVTDNAGNTAVSQITTVTTGTISEVGKATASPTTWTNKDVTVTLPTLSGFTTKYTINGTAPSTSSTTYNGPFTVSSNCTVLYVYTDGTNINSAGSLNVGNIDKTAPTNTAPAATNTTNSITVTNKQTDAGGSGVKTRQYSIDGGSTWKTGTDNTFTFTGLTQNKAYTVATQVTDNAGNVTKSQTLSVTTGTISEVGKATASPTTWTNKDVTVTLPTLSGFTTMYTTNGTVPTTTASSTTKTYSSPFTVSSNCTVLYVYTDGTNINSAGSLNVGNIDKTAPTNTAPTATNTTNSITITNKQTDAGGSGIKTRQYSIDGGSTWKTGTGNTYTFTGLTQNKAYTVVTQVTDNAGNVTKSQTLSVATGTISAVGRATATPTTWTSGDVTVTLPTLSGFTTKYTINGTAPSTNSTTYNGPFTVSSNCTVLYVYTDGTNINSAGSLNVGNIDKTAYTITYNLNGGSISGQPTTYKVDTANITLPTPTRAGYAFIGWTGSNDLSGGLGNYTSSSPYVASLRDHILGNEFSVTAGQKYRIFVKGTRTKGNLNLQGGIWYTAKSSGESYDGYPGAFTEISKGVFCKEITVPTGKTKGKFYIQLDQGLDNNYSTSWSLYDMHVVKVENTTIPEGSKGNKTYNANWQNKTAPITTAPTVTTTTNSITAINKQTDDDPGIESIQYQIKKNSDTTWGTLQSSGTFTGLTQGIKYDVRTHAVDKSGNASDSAVTTVTTGKISAVGKASATPTTLTSGDVTVTLPILSGFTTKYTINGTAPSTNSTTYNGPFTVSSNCTVLYVYTDGTNINSAGSLGITNIDKTAYTITYNLNGGSISGQPTTYKVDTANITLPTPTKTGYTFNGWTGSNGTTAQKSVTIAKGSRGNKTYTANWTEPSLPTTTNYTGYYADVNDDGTVDGVIFIDLAQGASGNWNPGNDSLAASNSTGVYSYSATSNLRNYKISTKVSSWSGNFGLKSVIAPNGTSGNARFYVMALSDYGSITYTWSDACSITQTVGSVTFRLPSKTEWAAFGGQLGIPRSIYSPTYGLRPDWYWSSTEANASNAYVAAISNGCMGIDDFTNQRSYVRLCATF